jgi:hypothetical protein
MADSAGALRLYHVTCTGDLCDHNEGSEQQVVTERLSQVIECM